MHTKLNIKVLVAICLGALLASSCLRKQAFSAQDIKLNPYVQERFQSGERTERNTFQYGQASDNALDIIVPIDPSGTKEIAKPHNYYLSKGSELEFNIETLVKYSTYYTDDDLEERGELVIPSQWMSVCTFRDPATGRKLKDVDGDDADIVFDAEDAFAIFTAYLRQCTGFAQNHPYLTEGGPLVQPCETIEFGSTDDPFWDQHKNTELYPVCMLEGRMTLETSSSFSQIIDVHSYNDNTIAWEDQRFMTDINPTFITVDDNIITYRVHMTPDPDNPSVVNGTSGSDNHLRYEWQMPTRDGLWEANFASDIDIAWVRFYWTDDHNNLLPIVPDPRLGGPPHEIQINFGNVCRNLDSNGYFNANGCSLFATHTPATPKMDLDNPITWRMAILYDPYNYEMMGYWGFPLVMEFGIKAD